MRPQLLLEEFVVQKDNSCFRCLINVKDTSGHLISWSLRLSEFRFEVRYKKGVLNSQTEALSLLSTRGGTTVDVGEN